VLAFAIAILAYELLHLVAETSMRATPSGNCRAVVILPARRPRDLRRFVGVVDYVVVDDEVDAAAAEAAGLRWILNKYEGKSGALATALEEVEADLYVFIDDDAYPSRWLEVLRGACGRFATAYRWVLDRLQNMFSLGGFDWMVWRQTRFLYGGAMTVPAARKRAATETLKRCPVDDMALTAVADDIEVLPLLVPMDGSDSTWEFFMRQSTAAKLGNFKLWLVETLYYVLWTVAAVFFPPLLLVHAVRTALRSRRALGRVNWVQVLLSPLERPLQAFVFAASAFRRCFEWRGRVVCDKC
jgi:hypothetical protein